MSEIIKERSGKRSYTSLAEILISVTEVEARVVLLVSRPNRSNCCSRDVAFLFAEVGGEVGGDRVLVGSAPPSSMSSESIQVVRLTTSLSLSNSCSMDVRFPSGWEELRSRLSRSASSVNESGGRHEQHLYSIVLSQSYSFTWTTTLNI